MQCPTDGTTLTMSERSGIEIDYCPTCRGVWLDRGELDKIIERSLTQVPAAPAAPAAPAQQGYDRSYDRGHDRGYDQGGQGAPYRKKKKESWLSELFD
jgi:uncharacterized protein